MPKHQPDCSKRWRPSPKPASPKERNKINGLLTALRFLTVIPAPGKRELNARALGRALPFFPVVGIFIGALLSGLNWLLRLILPRSVVSALLILSLTLITGGLHLDGFADTCDGMAGHKTPEARLAIMKDSHVGAFGVAGITLLILIKYLSLNSLPEAVLNQTLLVFPLVSRWLMVYAIFTYPYARAEGLGKTFKEGVTGTKFLLATVISLTTVFLTAGFAGLLLMGAAAMITAIFAYYLKRRLGGLTGDSYGAINEIAEVTTVISTLVLFRLVGQGWFNFM
ncbi:MAG: adenosylcobinamide-GDP ribazoletransferase [Chloroflexota bacterium]